MSCFAAVFRTFRIRREPRFALLVICCALAAIGMAGRTEMNPGASEYAYIGPGPGIAIIGSLLTVLGALLSTFLFMLTWPVRWVWRAIRGKKAYKKAKVRRLVVVGLDGLEPTLVEQFMAEGLLPNLARLGARGTYMRLGTTWPPLSPVAWSSFSTGTNPGKHNIFDFITRTTDYRPTISSVRIRDSGRKLRIGKLVIPLGKPEVGALRKSKPFWSVLGDHGVFSAVIRVPITFPPDKFRGVQLSAMCVPDLRGTQGMFAWFAESGEEGATMDGDVGGDRIRVRRNGNKVEGYLRGPANSLRADNAELRMPFKVVAAKKGELARLQIDGQEIALPVGQYTDWVRVEFAAAPGIKVRGVCRFYLKRFEPPFEMYCTPLQIDPDKPVMPISQPSVYSCYLARLLGPYATLGLAEDTWSLSEGLMSEDAFLRQAYDIHAERERMLFDALERVRQGMVVCVFDGPDRIQHMFWRFMDDQHPALRPEQRAGHRDAIRDMYVSMDDLVGRVMAKLGNGNAELGINGQASRAHTALIVMSDHGFKAFRRGVDLNAWLLANGYLFLKDGARTSNTPYLKDVDWARTRAYAIGLAGIFINQKGREASGIVAPGEESRSLIAELARRLTGLRDEASGEIAIIEAVPKRDVYHGPYVDAAPDVIVGYNLGYRVSWDASIGKCGPAVCSDNRKAWSGDHCIHPKLVPGVLFSDLELDELDANIIDLAPTALELFGVDKPDYMDGKSLLPGPERTTASAVASGPRSSKGARERVGAVS